jgi:D-alanine transfer protein
MEDTIHMGWLGWLAVDEELDTFLGKTPKPTYKINPYFYTKEWYTSK